MDNSREKWMKWMRKSLLFPKTALKEHFGHSKIALREHFFDFSCIIQRFTVFCRNLKIINMIEHIFKRKAYQKMLQWKQESHGETALLIEGARRVGKSTLVRQFAKNEYD